MNRAERAMQIWQILIAAAHERKTPTYRQIAGHLGFRGWGTMAQMLDLIADHCKTNNLPPLTCLVVSETTGMPGDGFTTVESLPRDREAVYKHNWFAMYPVQISDFQTTQK